MVELFFIAMMALFFLGAVFGLFGRNAEPRVEWVQVVHTKPRRSRGSLAELFIIGIVIVALLRGFGWL